MQKDPKHWKNITELSIATIGDNSVVIDNTGKAFTSTSTERINSIDPNVTPQAGLGIPSVYLQKPSPTLQPKSRSRNASCKTVHEMDRPHSIVSIVELSIEHRKQSMLVTPHFVIFSNLIFF